MLEVTTERQARDILRRNAYRLIKKGEGYMIATDGIGENSTGVVVAGEHIHPGNDFTLTLADVIEWISEHVEE